jgi:hypothetical protein
MWLPAGANPPAKAAAIPPHRLRLNDTVPPGIPTANP